MAKVTFDLPDEDCRAIDNEAADAGLARAPYVATIVAQRNQKGITVQANDQKMIGRLEGTIDTLKAQNTELADKYASASQKAGLAGLEKRNNVNDTTLKEYGEQLKKEWQAEMDARELIELRILKKENEERIRELEDHKTSNDKFDKALGTAKEVVLANPALLSGLAGMMGMNLGLPAAGLGSTPEDEHALTIGRAVVSEIDPAIQPELMIVLKHLSQVPGDINAIIKTKPFADARKRAMAEQTPAER